MIVVVVVVVVIFAVTVIHLRQAVNVNGNAS